MLTIVDKMLHNWPGRKRFGFYAFLPAFFFVGAAFELFMIKFRVGEIDFYTVYIQKERERMLEQAAKMNKMLDEKRAELEQKAKKQPKTE